MSTEQRLVAIVDDDPGVCRALARLVRSLGLAADVYASGEDLLSGLEARPPDDVLLDLHLPGLRAPDLLAVVWERGFVTRIVVMTGLDRPESREACLRAGAAAFIAKPITRADLASVLGPRA